MRAITSLALALASLAPATSNALAEARTVNLVSERVEPLILMERCRIVRAREPKGDLTYAINKQSGVRTVTRPIYSDLCAHPTQQFTSRIYSYLADDDQSPIVGFVGSNEDDVALSFPIFSSYVLKTR